jgi:hypothetical protein
MGDPHPSAPIAARSRSYLETVGSAPAGIGAAGTVRAVARGVAPPPTNLPPTQPPPQTPSAKTGTSPFDEAGIWSRISYSYVLPLLRYGAKK